MDGCKSRSLRFVYVAFVLTVMMVPAGWASSTTSTWIKQRAKRGAPVVPGQWHADFTTVKKFALVEGRPFFAVWSNGELCAHSLILERCFNTSVFKEWMESSGIVFWCGYEGDSSVEDRAMGRGYNWCLHNQMGFYPLVRLYWKDKSGRVCANWWGSGDDLDRGNSGDSGAKNVIKFINSKLKGWTPLPDVYLDKAVYTNGENVVVSCRPSTASIYYTTDGSDPTPNSSLYENPISFVSPCMTIKAFAIDGNSVTGRVCSLSAVDVQSFWNEDVGAKITDLEVSTRHPWNGKVDFRFKVDSTSDEDFDLIACAKHSNTSLIVRALSLPGEEVFNNPISINRSVTRLTWDAEKDLGKGILLKDVNVSLRLARPWTYLIVDLSAGPVAPYYPIVGKDSKSPEDGVENGRLVLKRNFSGSSIIYKSNLPISAEDRMLLGVSTDEELAAALSRRTAVTFSSAAGRLIYSPAEN